MKAEPAPPPRPRVPARLAARVLAAQNGRCDRCYEVLIPGFFTFVTGRPIAPTRGKLVARCWKCTFDVRPA